MHGHLKKRNISLENYHHFPRVQNLLCHCRKYPFATTALCIPPMQFKVKLYHNRGYSASKKHITVYYSYVVLK